MTEHTPTPWRVNQGTDPIVGDDYVEIMAASGVIVASVMDLPNRQALASRIVTAVNCHEELVQACRVLAGNFTVDPQWKLDNKSMRINVTFGQLRRARAALARAEGREP